MTREHNHGGLRHVWEFINKLSESISNGLTAARNDIKKLSYRTTKLEQQVSELMRAQQPTTKKQPRIHTEFTSVAEAEKFRNLRPLNDKDAKQFDADNILRRLLKQ